LRDDAPDDHIRSPPPRVWRELDVVMKTWRA